MFGQRIDDHITMLQRVVALLRDLVLAVTLGLTCLIVYFGGDASKLNVLDWTKLTGSALFIVVGPIFGLLFGKALFEGFKVATSPFYYFLLGEKLPKSIWVWWIIGRKRKSKREYVSYWQRRYKYFHGQFAQRYPQRYENFTDIVHAMNQFERFVVRYYGHLLAVTSLMFAVVVFRDLIRNYIP